MAVIDTTASAAGTEVFRLGFHVFRDDVALVLVSKCDVATPAKKKGTSFAVSQRRLAFVPKVKPSRRVQYVKTRAGQNDDGGAGARDGADCSGVMKSRMGRGPVRSVMIDRMMTSCRLGGGPGGSSSNEANKGRRIS